MTSLKGQVWLVVSVQARGILLASQPTSSPTGEQALRSRKGKTLSPFEHHVISVLPLGNEEELCVSPRGSSKGHSQKTAVAPEAS